MGKKKKCALQVIMEDGWYRCEVVSVWMLSNTWQTASGLSKHTILCRSKVMQFEFARAGKFCQPAKQK